MDQNLYSIYQKPKNPLDFEAIRIKIAARSRTNSQLTDKIAAENKRLLEHIV